MTIIGFYRLIIDPFRPLREPFRFIGPVQQIPVDYPSNPWAVLIRKMQCHIYKYISIIDLLNTYINPSEVLIALLEAFIDNKMHISTK